MKFFFFAFESGEIAKKTLNRFDLLRIDVFFVDFRVILSARRDFSGKRGGE